MFYSSFIKNELFHVTKMECSDNRGVWIIKFWIIEVGLYYFHGSNYLWCFDFCGFNFHGWTQPQKLNSHENFYLYGSSMRIKRVKYSPNSEYVLNNGYTQETDFVICLSQWLPCIQGGLGSSSWRDIGMRYQINSADRYMYMYVFIVNLGWIIYWALIQNSVMLASLCFLVWKCVQNKTGPQ